ncbi:hypothetical protein O9929_26300 [Vibrio lentus]|nr:hypothetical protein [Vibrio lentus]
MAVGYSITYIFGSLGQFYDDVSYLWLLGWNITKKRKKLAEQMGSSGKQLNEGEFTALN